MSISSVFDATTGALAITSNAQDAISISVRTDGTVTVNGAVLNAPNPVAASAVQTLTVMGGSGNNRINLSRVNSTRFAALTSVNIDGGAGNDNIVGSPLSDHITGGAGNDTLNGGNGDDTLNGGEGNDLQNGQAGNDQLNGDNGNDTLNGGDGDDLQNGQDGNDQLNGNNGNDSLFGGRGNDRLDGGTGADKSTGGDGKDTIKNDGRDDVIQNGDNDGQNGNNDGQNGNNDGQNGNNNGQNGNNNGQNGNNTNSPISSQSSDGLSVPNSAPLITSQLLMAAVPPPPQVPNIPQAVAAAINFDGVNQVVVITGTAGDDVVTLDLLVGNMVRVRIVTGTETVERSFALADVSRVTFDAGDGNDRFTTTTSIAVSVNGGGGNDSIISGLGNDTLDGGDGNDTLRGTGLDDWLLGGAGDDCLLGGSGNDSLDGGSGNDRLFGEGSSFDTLRGGLGNDTLDGGAGTSDLLSEEGDVHFKLTATSLTGLGTDSLLNLEGAMLVGGNSANRIDVSLAVIPTTLTGGLGNDTIIGGAGRDILVESGDVNLRLTNTLLTGLGTDSLSGLDGALLTGAAGNNSIDASGFSKSVTLFGGDGNDTLIGGAGVDRIDGEAGNDWITGGAGANTLFGGEGVDRVIETSNSSSFTVSNASVIGTATERIYSFEEAELTGGASANYLAVASNFTGPVTLNGGDGNDTLVGNSFDDVLNGGRGNDSINGGDGHDTLLGGDGNDTLQGQTGNDSLDGGIGADIGLGGIGDDTLLGGMGRDVLIGSAGLDSIDGGNDDDIVLGGSSKYDTNLTALTRIATIWNSTSSYASRVSQLRSTSYAYFLKSLAQIGDTASVYDDYMRDTVNGGMGTDFFLRPGDQTLPSIDVTPDRLASETMDISVYGTENPGFFPADVTMPGYLQTLNDPTFGTPITRITDDAGTSLTVPVNTGGVATTYWSGAVRTRYVTDSSWNVDGSLLMVRSYDPAQPYHLMLDGTTYQPRFLASLPTTNYRWSQNPATPTIQYGFLQASVVDANSVTEEGIVTALPAAGPDDDKIVRYDVTTGEIANTITLPFNKLFSTKTTIAFVNGHEYVAVYGVSKTSPSPTAITLYIVQLDGDAGTNPVVASMLLTTSDSGTPEAAYAKSLDFANLWFSPDGQHVLTLYNGSTSNTRSWRLLDVNYPSVSGTAGSITSHVIPNLTADNSFQVNGDRTKGHFPVNWSHPVFAFGADGDVYVVGVSGQFNGRSFSQSEIATANGRVGSVLAFNVDTNRFQALTDPTNENAATHITATNTQHGGYVFVSYANDTAYGSNYSGELVAISLENPFAPNGIIELAHHRSSIANHFYHGYPLPTVSPDGKKLIFSSTWGPRQSVVQSFVLDLTALPQP